MLEPGKICTGLLKWFDTYVIVSSLHQKKMEGWRKENPKVVLDSGIEKEANSSIFLIKSLFKNDK